VTILVDGALVARRVAVDDRGRFETRLRADFDLGGHDLEVVQRGPARILSARATFHVVPEEEFEAKGQR
jgi:hypothetical protein